MFTVNPVKNAECCAVKSSGQVAVFCLYDSADEVNAVVTKVLDYGKAALIDGLMLGGVNQFQEIAGMRSVQPPCFTVKAAFCGS